MMYGTTPHLTRDEAEMICETATGFAARRTDRSHATDLDDSSARLWGVYDMTARRWLSGAHCSELLHQLRKPRSIKNEWQRYPADDRRIANGDAFAGDAWLNTTTGEIRHAPVGHVPEEWAP